ncbi:GNAT family N-acetyltransferase [Acinetobacter faecalis]|uniref:GNAT family N-acetyltransferase n=1 Tax=Acinetobacter faecalis TaxID=2665161 RepID=UPI002A911084|nr:GNAT family N-acetyltransferase [Acinetobacter faecalis]MDY6449620.1 GNAT family N-acetyltransferase [Acinetobacter faecalis]
MDAIIYKVNFKITVDDYIDLLSTTSLGDRRPITNRQCIEGMLKNSNLIVSAWVDRKLIGVSRSVTDFYYCCYLSDLAVSEHFQKYGIGKKLIDLTMEQLQSNCNLILFAAPQATGYYPKVGFTQHLSAWIKNKN